MEQIDICNPDGTLTGRTADRSFIHTHGLWHRTVHVWMHSEQGDLLFQLRSLTKETHPGLWDISCAGHLSAGDSSIDGAVREAKEELGLSIDSTHLCHLFTLHQHWESPNRSIIENEIKDVYHYTAPVTINQIHLDSDEVSDVRFLPIQQLEEELEVNKDLFVPHDEEYKKLLDYLLKK